MNEINETKKCSKCGRELPLERFRKFGTVCKSCCSTYNVMQNGNLSDEDIIKIERIYKEPIPERILNVNEVDIELIEVDECFVRLINYKNAWISNYGRVLEYNNGKYVLKRTKIVSA